jgi:MFS superfamily sulfate permease-like transporter
MRLSAVSLPLALAIATSANAAPLLGLGGNIGGLLGQIISGTSQTLQGILSDLGIQFSTNANQHGPYFSIR